MSIIVKQISSAFFLLIGLIATLSWHEWKDSPLWVLVVGVMFILLGVVGTVLTIQESAEKDE